MSRQEENADQSAWRLPPPLPLGLYRRSVAVFLAALALFIIGLPFAEQLPNPGLVEGALLTLVMLCGVLAVGGRKKMLALAAALALAGLAAKWVHHFRPDLVAPGIYLTLGISLLVVVAIQLLRFILRAPRVDAEVLSAGVATYLVLGLIWALAYLLTASLVPNAFAIGRDASAGASLDGFHALYFSFVTLSTVGYGDVVPVAPVVRMLAMVEGITGVLYLAILIARLVTLYTDR